MRVDTVCQVEGTERGAGTCQRTTDGVGLPL